MTRLIVVRHAQSEGNLGKFFTGQVNVNLTPTGHIQAERTAKLLDEYPIDLILSSPLVRVQQTALHTAERRGMGITLNPGLLEINGGIWEGHNAEEFKATYPDDWNLWDTDFINVTCPGGESICDLIHRITVAFDQIVRAYPDKTVAVFTHATPIRIMTTYWKHMPWRKIGEQPWANNASVTVVRYDDPEHFTLEREAYADHLTDLLGGII